MSILFSLKNVTVRHRSGNLEGLADSGCITALKNLSLSLNSHEFVVILGENGSGKSTLARLLAGFAQEVNGEIHYKGIRVEKYGRQAFEDVALVLQEPQYQILMPTIYEELAFPLENTGMTDQQIDQKVKLRAEQFGLSELLERSPEELSGGQLTALAIASVLITDPQTIILDEPDSHLDRANNDVLNKFLVQHKHELTIILITQFPQSARTADRVIVLREGAIVADGRPDEIFADPALAGDQGPFAEHRAAHDVASDTAMPGLVKNYQNNQLILSLKNISFAYAVKAPALQDISFDIKPGDKVALVGPSGSGKSTLGLVIAGLLTPQAGAILLNGRDSSKYPPIALRKIVTMAMQFPERALFEETVAADVGFGPRNLAFSEFEKIAQRYISIFDLEPFKDRHPFTLSGGEKRKTGLAGILAMETPLVVLDEPSASLDIGATRQLWEFISANSQRAYLIISHDLQFLAKICDRVIGLDRGHLVCDRPIMEFLANDAILAKLNLSR